MNAQEAVNQAWQHHTIVPAFNIPHLPMAKPVIQAIIDEKTIAMVQVARLEWEKFEAQSPEAVAEEYFTGQPCTLVNGRFVKPMDTDVIDHLAGTHHTIVTLEENVLRGGYGERVTDYVQKHYPQIKVVNIALPDAYVEHGNVSVLRNELGIDSDSILAQLKREGVLETDAEA